MRPINIDERDRPVRSSPKKAKKSPIRARKPRKKASANGGVMPLAKLKSGFKGVSAFLKLIPKIGGQKKPKPTSRRKPQKSWYRAAIVGGAVLAVALPVGGAGYYIVQAELVQKAGVWLEETKQSAIVSVGFTVQEISVAGRERTSPKKLMQALAVARGDSILDFDPEEARIRVERLGWVETASVMRRFPDEVFIRINERRPFARWQLKGKTAVIDRNGAVVTRKDSAEFRYLPKVVGSGANEDAAELFDVLAKTPQLFTRLQNAVRIRDRRWNLEFDTGVTVMLPEEEAGAAWQRLNQMQQDKKVLNKGVMAIDLRSTEKMYVRLKPDDAEMRRIAGKET